MGGGLSGTAQKAIDSIRLPREVPSTRKTLNDELLPKRSAGRFARGMLFTSAIKVLHCLSTTLILMMVPVS